MRLLIIMICDEDREKMLQSFVEKGYTPTYVASTGDFLQFGKSIFMLGVEEEKVEEVKQIVETHTKKAYIKDGEELKGQIFVIPADMRK